MAQPKRVNSLIRGLEILESFTPSESRLGLQELSIKTGLPKTTVHRFLKTLLALNYVTLDPRARTYSLAPRVMALGFSVLSGMDLRQTALPFMEALSRETDQNVNLAVLDRSEMLYIERIMVRKIINTNLHVGSRVNCYLTAMGRSLIAYLSRERYDRLLQELLEDGEAVTRIGRHGEKLGKILEDVRLKGYATNDGEWIPGLRAIGVPIFNGRGDVEASLNMSFISQMVTFNEMIETFVPPLMATAGRISAALENVKPKCRVRGNGNRDPRRKAAEFLPSIGGPREALENHRLPQQRLPGRPGQLGHIGMGAPEGGDLSQVVGRSRDEHGHVAVGKAVTPDDPVPVAAAGPVVDHGRRPEGKGIEPEALGIEPFHHGEDRVDDAVVGRDEPAGQLLALDGDLLPAIVDEGCDHGGQQRRVVPGQCSPSQALGDQHGVIEPQLRRPDAVGREPVVLAHEPLGLQEVQVTLKGPPEP